MKTILDLKIGDKIYIPNINTITTGTVMRLSLSDDNTLDIRLIMGNGTMNVNVKKGCGSFETTNNEYYVNFEDAQCRQRELRNIYLEACKKEMMYVQDKFANAATLVASPLTTFEAITE